MKVYGEDGYQREMKVYGEDGYQREMKVYGEDGVDVGLCVDQMCIKGKCRSMEM